MEAWKICNHFPELVSINLNIKKDVNMFHFVVLNVDSLSYQYILCHYGRI